MVIGLLFYHQGLYKPIDKPTSWVSWSTDLLITYLGGTLTREGGHATILKRPCTVMANHTQSCGFCHHTVQRPVPVVRGPGRYNVGQRHRKKCQHDQRRSQKPRHRPINPVHIGKDLSFIYSVIHPFIHSFIHSCVFMFTYSSLDHRFERKARTRSQLYQASEHVLLSIATC